MKKMTIELSKKMVNLLDEIRGDYTKVDMIRKSIFLYATLREKQLDGNKICVMDKDEKNITELIFNCGEGL